MTAAPTLLKLGTFVPAFAARAGGERPTMRQLLAIDYATCEYCLAATQLVLATVGMGVALRPRDFGQVLRTPRALVLVFVAQLLLTPPLALALDAAFDLPPGFALGMVLMAAMPVGAMAGIFVHLGRGQATLALAATGLTTLTSLLTTPAILHALGSGQLPGDFAMPVGKMLAEFGGFLLLPLAAAMTLARFSPRASGRIGRWCVRGSLVTMTSLIVGSLASGRLQVAVYGWRAPAAIGAFAAVTFLLCQLVGRLISLSAAESFTVGVLATVRNGNLGLLLKASLFPALAGAGPVANAVLYVVLFYSGASLVVSAVTIFVRRATQRAAARREEADEPLAGNVLASS
jgi:BASS family bile acid:Na+ symporter